MDLPVAMFDSQGQRNVECRRLLLEAGADPTTSVKVDDSDVRVFLDTSLLHVLCYGNRVGATTSALKLV